MNVAMVNPGKKTKAKASNPKKRKKPMTVKQAKALAKAWKKRTGSVPPKIAAKAGLKASNPAKKSRKKSTANKGTKRNYGKKSTATSNKGKKRSYKKKSSSNPRVKGYSYFKPSLGRTVKVPGHTKKKARKSSANPSKPRKATSTANKGKKRVKGYSYYRPSTGTMVKVKGYSKRKNPATVSAKGFLPSFSSIKKQFYFAPKRRMLYPTFKEIKAHPIATAIGLPIGFVSSAALGGIGRVLGGKNVVVSELLGIAGNFIGFELPARIVGMFNFKSKDVMVKSIRAGGLVATVISLLLGLVRIGISMKNKGVKDTVIPKKRNWGVGQFKFNKITEIPKKALKAVGFGCLSMSNPISDLVTSGREQGYTAEEPMGISDEFLSDDYMDEPDIVYGEEIEEDLPWYSDSTLGDPGLVDQIQKMAKDLGLSDNELNAMASDDGHYDEEELDGLGQIAVPKDYAGGFSKEFVY